jgi:predicted SnoaL-like aldol condensation-catalyzing enzyme
VKYRINGKEVTRERFLKGAKANGVPQAAATYRGHDPLVSDGMGCMKAQVPEMREAIAKRGIQGVRVKDSGQLEITSRRGRKEVLRMRGFVDNEGSYGD